MDIKEKVSRLPASPGVYIMKGASGEVLYVGKAINLRKRVASYFQPNRYRGARIDLMVGKISDISYLSTVTEAEALIYENSLIKQLSPRYNVALKDGKSYPRLKLTVNERFPRLLITRKVADDGAVYYGPYTSAKLLKEALIMLRKLFPLRTCVKLPKKLCLNYHIAQCAGPCESKITEECYRHIVSELKLFLDGNREELIKYLTGRMLEASGKEEFEEASCLKGRIEALSSMGQKAISYIPRDEVDELREILGIAGRVDIIEAFDVSNTMGQDAVGSMVHFYRGRPRKSLFRRFLIKSVEGADDYSMMREIVARRYGRLIDEKKRLPDLILIDGGKGHVASAFAELARLGVHNIPVIGLAKEFEYVYSTDRAEPIILPRDSKSLHLLERIRDEAHRFANDYHKTIRKKKMTRSELDGIEGIGAVKKALLIKRFGSVDGLRSASLAEVASINGINDELAKRIIAHIKR